jgi:2-polyprenyl-3-methyl-5-hydroxy-6-metoxy-1,4-benzoquinol methylase
MERRNPPKDETYYQGLNQWLLRAVPQDAVAILEVGCAEGRLGEALMRNRPDRRVSGIERESVPAREASRRLHRVFELDVEQTAPDLPPGSFDCILFGDVLEHLRDPLGAIANLLPLLRQDGTVLCCVPNVQHASVLAALLRGDFQYQPLGIMDETHVRFFTYASFTKLLLDAGLEPEIVDHVPSPPGTPFMEALGPALRHVGADPALAQVCMGSYQYLFRARPLGWRQGRAEEPMSFVACVNDEARLQDNLLASPCLRGATIHEIITVRGARSVGEALQAALAQAIHPLVVLVHQDVYLPAGWVQQFQSQWKLAEQRFGRVGLLGVYGASLDPATPGEVRRTGHLADRNRLLRDGVGPAMVDTLDEVLLAMPRGTPLRISPGLGFHMYGSDLGCRARELGLRVVAVDAPLFHNSLLGDALPAAFHESVARFRDVWRSRLPVATNCGLMEAPRERKAAAEPSRVSPAPLPAYYQCSRPEVVARARPAGLRVLDVGCAAGAMGAAMLAAGAAEVAGIEVHPPAAALARRRLSAVHGFDLDRSPELPYPDGYFDVITFADVLEHLRHPAAALRHLRRWLSDSGRIVCSIPNVRHASVLLPLLVEGRWDYLDAGILDRTHLRFFTIDSMLRLLREAGFEPEGPADAVASPPLPAIEQVAALVGALGGDPIRFRQESQVVQVVLSARPAEARGVRASLGGPPRPSRTGSSPAEALREATLP